MDSRGRRTTAQQTAAFRGGQAEPLSSEESWLLTFAGANLVFLPWAFGGMTIWSQWISFALSLAAFAIALFTPNATSELTARTRLLRFPLFWLGLLYFAVIAVQMLNPAWRYEDAGESWQLRRAEHVAWLPHGIANNPFRMVNAWRILLIHGSVWLTVCALWVGITRRKPARVLITIIAANGAVVALVFILQRLTGAHRILWLWDAPADYFVAGFVYKNHAGAYFNLILAACLGLASWHAARAQRQMKKSHPGLLFVLLAIFVFVALAFTYARAATMLGAAILLIVALVFTAKMILRPARVIPRSILVVLLLLGAGFIGVCAVSMDGERVWEKFGRLMREDEQLSVTFRRIATRATLEMAGASPVVGHGAGSFRFIFPLYQQHYPEIYGQRAGTIGPVMFWEHAHDDYVEWLAEYGYVGVAFALTILLCLIAALWRAKFYQHAGMLLVLAGPLAMLANAAVDFPFQNPAVFLTGVVTLTVITRWAQLEPRSRMVPGAMR
jgi:O-antigen ligase